MRLAHIAIDLSPLRDVPAFRIVFTARLVSLFGIGFTMVALPLQVYAITGSSFMVATVAAAAGVSTFCGTLAGGLLADRMDRRTLMVIGRAAGTAAFAALAVNCAVPGGPYLAVIYGAAVVNGLIGAFSAVALQAAAPGLVGKDRLAATGALIALTTQLGSVLAPALGGVIIAAWGFGVNYTVTAAASALTTVVVARLPPLRPGAGDGKAPIAAAIRSGLGFAARHRVVGPLLLLGFAQLLFATPQVLIPQFTAEVLGGGEGTAGLLYTAPAVGAVLGSLTSGWTGRVHYHGALLPVVVAVCGTAVAGFGLSPWPAAAFAVLVVLGFAEVTEEILRYSLLQAHTPDPLRGRVNSLWTAQATVGTSLGAMTLGALAPLVGPVAAIVAGGALTVASAAAVAALFPGLRAAWPSGEAAAGAGEPERR
ncbi:ENTS family enterobactin (siderophore) exporter [Murinocardiopsis flavida]|uniref:ENTS family enterobactin (Siderophore) exporter n=1 Tax=Murinocardiopsis flavida TaxID=645275 RepID=A0A2P8DLM8_9ACTN|nr:enterobactin transporter EntS [Murinocardiopsis flavida]PSK98143.1 ENTS family enterobactin (siderophore) exporter [Murinocardiopsis flavida]